MTVFYPPHIEFSGQPEISIYAPTGSEPSAVIHWAGGNEHITGVAQADERIAVYLKAKEMLAAHRHAVANHAGIGEYVNGTRDPCPADWGSGTESQRCTWLAGHGVVHRDCTGREWTDETRAHVMSSSPGRDAEAREINAAAGWDPSACAECGSREGTVVDGWHPECRRYREGLPVAEDDGGDGDDNREPYCVKCGFTLDAAGNHLYPDDAVVVVHETVLGWREPVGVPSGEDAQAAEVRRIGKLCTDGHITDAECQQMVDKVLGDATGRA